jgi:hypothetical protein
MSQSNNILASAAFMSVIEQFAASLPAMLSWEGVLRDEET